MKEVIVVCVVYGESGSALLSRAAGLARQSKAKLYVFVHDSRSEEFDNDRLLDLALYKATVKEYGGHLRHVQGDVDDMVDHLADFAREVNATQVFVGQRSESALARLFGWSVVESILEAVPFADLHIVPRERSRESDWDYEPSRVAWVVSTEDGRRRITATEPEKGILGLFFRETDTDFDTGFFLYKEDGRIREVEVSAGFVL